MLRFSIVTCTWNSVAYLDESIASVLSQDWPQIEYIFVDGGSTDGTLDRIEAIPREKILIRNVRGGVSRAMNAGLEVASGDIIAHLHSDDYYLHPQVLSLVAEVFEQTQTKWLFGRAMNDMNDGRVLPEGWVVPRYSYPRLLKGNFIPHQATFVHRDLFRQVGGFDERNRYAMDYDLWLRLGKVSTPVQLDTHLVAFRRHPGSLTTANYMASMREDFRVRMRHIGLSPALIAYHGAHFLVRQVRYMIRQLMAGRQ
jgi:glycosyltransferase involved in cell wall biosynthesis